MSILSPIMFPIIHIVILPLKILLVISLSLSVVTFCASFLQVACFVSDVASKQKYQKHARLKILNKQCAFPDLDPSHGLTSPGFNQPTNRSLEAEHQLNEKHNKAEHTPLWNRKLGKIQSKPDHGKLWCSSGGKSWPWSARASTLSKPRCHPSCQIPEGPSWVLQLDRYNPPSSHQSSHTVPQSAVRRRIAGKQSVTQTTSQTESVTSSGAAASSSTTVCRRGIS